MFKRIDHVEVITPDLDRSIDFYTNVLGFKPKSRHKMDAGPLVEIAYLTLGDTMVELMKVKENVALPNSPWQIGCRIFALEVEDMDKAVEYLKANGVEISWGPMQVGSGKRAEMKDQDGNSIELRQW